MIIQDSVLYQEDINYVCGLDLPWQKLQGKKNINHWGNRNDW